VVNPHKRSQILLSPRKGTSLTENMRFGVYRQDLLRNATCACGEENQKNRKERKKLYLSSHIFAQTTHVALPAAKISWGGQGSRQPCQVSSKMGSGFSSPWWVEICHFPIGLLNAVAYVTG